nr:hypothetical protein [Paracoccus saliphilus]
MTEDDRHRDDAVDQHLAQLWALYEQQPLSEELRALVERLRAALKS